MSRAGYSEDCEDLWLYRGAVRKAITGKRGRAFLMALRDAMEAMPDKALISGTLEEEGSFCTLGVMGAARGLNLESIDVENYEQLGKTFGIAKSMAREIMYANDEGWGYDEDPYKRWLRMRKQIDRWLAGDVE